MKTIPVRGLAILWSPVSPPARGDPEYPSGGALVLRPTGKEIRMPLASDLGEASLRAGWLHAVALRPGVLWSCAVCQGSGLQAPPWLGQDCPERTP